MFRAIPILLFLSFTCIETYGQISNYGSFRFLEVPVHAFITGMGGVNSSMNDRDVNMFISNPSLVGESLDKHASLSYMIFPADIKISNATYFSKVANTGYWGVNLVYFNYGEIDGYDPTGAPNGSFVANEYAITINKSHMIGNYRLGANLRYAHSGISGYTSSALIADLGGLFIHPAIDFTAGLVIKNAGIVLTDYTESSRSRIPLDVQVGTSFKPEHMPVRFVYTLYNLTNWDKIDESEAEDVEAPGNIEEFFRHSIFGAEFLIGKNVELLFGYNHKRRKEMQLNSVSGSSGFSYGIRIGVHAFEFGFSRNAYHLGGISNSFTLTSDLSRWIGKKEITE